MGAWGVKPFASDGALDWLGSSITTPMAETMALRGFLTLATLSTLRRQE